MEIQIGQKGGIQSRGGKLPEGATVIAANLKKQSTVIDRDGNIVSSLDPKEKHIIKKKDTDTK